MTLEEKIDRAFGYAQCTVAGVLDAQYHHSLSGLNPRGSDSCRAVSRLIKDNLALALFSDSIYVREWAIIMYRQKELYDA